MLCLKMNIILLFSIISASSALQCMDENNKPVDWFVAYKYPKIKGLGALFQSGVAYSFITSQDLSSWKESKLSINSSNSIIGNTLKELYGKNKNFFYVLYNDQPPNKASIATKGHTKGVVMAENGGGFWLVHSVPHFPALGTTYVYPTTGTAYGQSLLCISLNLANLNNVGTQLQYNEPQIYEANVLQNLKASLPELVKAASNITNTKAPWYHVSSISSKQGVSFTSFAKSKQFNKDLYEDLVAPSLQSDLYVETWPNGAGKIKSDCSKQFKVNNVVDVSFKNLNVTFKTTEDHSKWAVSPTKTWICVGDINRMEHQKVRGGGTVCLNNKQLTTDYQKIVAAIEQCPKQLV